MADGDLLGLRGLALIVAGRSAEALQLARELEKLIEPELQRYAPTYGMSCLPAIYELTGRSDEALRYFRKLRAAFPREDNVKNNLAWFLATTPDAKSRNGADALQLATAANRVGGFRDPAIADTYAAALAECGRFEEAAARQRDVTMRFEREPGLAGEVAGSRGRTKLYESRKPYRKEIGRQGAMARLAGDI